VGLVVLQAASGQVREALAGYGELVDHWERTGAWTQQWTTLRNAADLFEHLGDHDVASFLRSTADTAPEAAGITAITTSAAADAGDHAAATRAVDTTHQAPTREHVLDVTRQAIARWLDVTRPT
jgi:hypothetical protein